jgi:hypothetical protein
MCQSIQIARQGSNAVTTPEPEFDPEVDRRLEEERARGFQLIGEFTFWYSQLQFTIQVRLAAELKLPDELIDMIIAPYDFFVLCTVTKNVLLKKYDDPKDRAAIEKVLNQCAALNDERVRVAHGMWSHGPAGLAAAYVARRTLQRGYHFDDPDELPKLIDNAKELMLRVMEIPGGPNRQRGRLTLLSEEYVPDDRLTPPKGKPPRKR